jgi:hypothetical protein
LGGQLGRDHPQRHAPALRPLTVQSLRPRHQRRVALSVALTPFTLAGFTACDAIF